MQRPQMQRPFYSVATPKRHRKRADWARSQRARKRASCMPKKRLAERSGRIVEEGNVQGCKSQARREVMSDKAEEAAAGPKGQVRRPGKPITLPPFKKRLSMPLPSVREEGDGASQPKGSAMSWEDDDPKVTAMLGDVPDQLPIPVKINMEIKEQLKKEFQQFGGKYEKVFKLLEGVQGPPEVQKKFVVYAMKEAARFKRQDLISHLGKLLDKLEYDQFLKKDDGFPEL